MSLIAKDNGGGDFTPTPQGTHLAVCNMVVDLGNQESTYQGQTSVKHQCFIRWELPQERIEFEQDGEKKEGPMVIGKRYTLSLNEKATLRKDLEAWRGKSFTPEELEGFDLFKLLGVACQVTVTHREKDGKTYANVTGVAGWPKGMDRPQPEIPVLKYSEDEPGQYSELPEWLQKVIGEQKPNDHMVNHPEDPGYDDSDAGGGIDDEIPF